MKGYIDFTFSHGDDSGFGTAGIESHGSPMTYDHPGDGPELCVTEVYLEPEEEGAKPVVIDFDKLDMAFQAVIVNAAYEAYDDWEPYSEDRDND